MKRKINKILYLIAIVLFLSSCSFEDKSTFVEEVSPEIIIDTTGIPVKHMANRGEKLVITPKVSRVGTSPEQFSYEWKLTTLPGSDFTNSIVISTEQSLNKEIMSVPDANPYSLWYRVTDKTTGLMKSIMWTVTVEASSGQGLVVAYTKDNTTTDFAVVQDTLFTYSYEDENKVDKPRVYKMDIFSKRHKKTFNGVVKNMFSQTRYLDGRSTYMLHGASDKNAFRISTLEYDVLLEGKELFYDPYVELDITSYFLASYAIMVNKGRIMTIPTERNTAVTPSKVGIDVPGDYFANEYLSDNSSSLAWYDETQGKFMYTATYLNFTRAPSLFVASEVFDPNNMLGYKVIAGGYGNKSDHRFILKKEGKIGLYTLNRTAPYTPRYFADITNAPEIDKAVDFIILRDQETLLYATPNKIYAVVFTSTIPVYKLFYETTETITNLKMLRKTGSKAVPYAEKCVLAIINQGNNGQIHAIKLGNMNTGMSEGEVTILSGFNGRITAVTVQD